MSNAVKVKAQTGQGITGILDRCEVLVGKASFVGDRVGYLPNELIAISDRCEEKGQTIVWVASAGKVLGFITLVDTVRPESRSTLMKLRKLGITPIAMLTGDNDRSAQNIGLEIGVDRVYSELLPEDKVEVIRRLHKQHQTVAMVGDGINDVPALAISNVGIAMGAAGSDLALETADVILMADKLEKLEHAIKLGRRSQAIIKQNIIIAIGSVILLLIANFWGDITLPLSVIGHEGSTVLVTLNGLRLLK